MAACSSPAARSPTSASTPGATTQGRTELHLWQRFFIAGLVVGGFVLLLILWAVFRYRRRSDEMPKQTQYHTLLEITYTVVPIIIVVGAVRVHRAGREQGRRHAGQSEATIHVNAFQWGWEFEYPGGPGSGCANPGSTRPSRVTASR